MELSLRLARDEDKSDVYSWRNHPEVRRWSFHSDPISWEEHEAWWTKILRCSEVRMYIGQQAGNKIGMIRFDHREGPVRVSVMLNPDFMGRKLGRRLIALGVEAFWRQEGLRPILAEIKPDNIASQKAFEKAGFQQQSMTYVLNPSGSNDLENRT